MPQNNSACRSRRNGEPLSAYSSKTEAEDAAVYVRGNYGWAPVPYRCPLCKQWHLSPKDRQTPSRACNFCNKDLYESSAAATRRAKIIYDEQKIRLDVYKCPHGAGWHLTRKRRGRE
jgi:hypothetical protein